MATVTGQHGGTDRKTKSKRKHQLLHRLGEINPTYIISAKILQEEQDTWKRHVTDRKAMSDQPAEQWRNSHGPVGKFHNASGWRRNCNFPAGTRGGVHLRLFFVLNSSVHIMFVNRKVVQFCFPYLLSLWLCSIVCICGILCAIVSHLFLPKKRFENILFKGKISCLPSEEINCLSYWKVTRPLQGIE